MTPDELDALEKAAANGTHAKTIACINLCGDGCDGNHQATDGQLLSLIAELSVYRKALGFFAEPFTWSRVMADALHADLGSGLLNNMYGSKAREALEAGKKVGEP